jgi:undecaprenyl-diphosphatase
MDHWQSLVLGLVQGLTEFLPVSSTAHLRVMPALLGWPDPGAAWSAVIQLGTLAAVLVYFARDVGRILAAFLKGVFNGHPFRDEQSRLGWILILGTAPIAAAGLLFEDAIEGALRSLWVVAAALAGFAALLLVAEIFASRHRTLREVTWLDGLIVGAFQALALVPGASRSGVTLSGGFFLGFSRADAARLSFLLSIPAVALSGAYELWKLLRGDLGPVELTSMVLGAAAAFASGLAAIAALMWLLRTHSTAPFIVYRILLALAIGGLLLGGALQP